MQHRYSRAQSGQGSLPRPAWNSGNHSARATSPEPGSGTPIGGADPNKTHDRNEDVICQMESEIAALSNACAMKDQRIAELQRSEAHVGRLRRDIRSLAAELHATRKMLAERESANDRAKSSSSSAVENSSGGANKAPCVADRGTNNADSSSDGQLRDSMRRLSMVEDENRQLKDAIGQLTAQNREVKAELASYEAEQQARQAQSRQTSTASVAYQADYKGSAPSTIVDHSIGQHGFAGHAAVVGGEIPPQLSTLYSTLRQERTSTVGPMMVDNRMVDGVESVAKLVLQKVSASAYYPRTMQPGATHLG